MSEPEKLATAIVEMVKICTDGVTEDLRRQLADAVAAKATAEAACAAMRECGMWMYDFLAVKVNEASSRETALRVLNEWHTLTTSPNPGEPYTDRLARLEEARVALESQVEILRTCDTCDGVGGLRMKTGEDSQGNEQFGEMEQCPQCNGTGVNEWATTTDKLAAQAKEIADLTLQVSMLATDNNALSDAGGTLAEAAARVMNTYDGVHRLSLALSGWFTAVANEGGRKDRFRKETER